jgi:hypothetical protein
LSITCELAEKFVPVTVRGMSGELILIGVLVGLTIEIVGGAEGTTNVKELLFAGPTETET